MALLSLGRGSYAPGAAGAAPLTRRFWIYLCGSGLLLALALLAAPTDARPGGGRSYVAPSRSSYRSSPSRSSSYRSSSGSYRSSSGYRSSTPRYSSSSGSSRSSTVVVLPVTTGGSYGSSGGGSSGSGWKVGAIVAITIVVAVVLVGLVLLSRGKRERAKIAVDARTQHYSIGVLRGRDPGFDPAKFCERTKATMAKTNEAWCAASMSPVRRLLSDGVFVRFQTQLALLKASGLRNAMAEWSVVSAEILAAEADDLWDTVHVKVVGRARDTEVPIAMPKEEAERKVRGAPLEEYHECWSFVRRRGAKSKDGVPALEGRCPGCGADMPLSESVRCEYCKAVVNSGEHDWVLAEITQPEEWMPGAALDKIPGMAELRQRDSTVSRQELEDRASVIFWKWIEARATGKLENLTRFCLAKPDPATLGVVKAQISAPTVGSSEVVKVVAGNPGQEGAMDLAQIEIRWSAGIDGKAPEGMIHVLALQRLSSVQSKRSMSALDCPVCAGPLPESDAAFCAYCGEQLMGGKHEWALAAVVEGEYVPDDLDEDELDEEDDDR